MQQAIRKHLRDFIAVVALLAAALVITWVILQEQRLRVPVLEERPFELKAEFETAQAVVPGQGQTIRVAGVRIGDVQKVELEGGVGVVTFAVDREFLPIYRDATLLLRPTTGLKDMFFDLDPGTKAAGEFEEGATMSSANTAPDVNLDEILEALDADTQAYLRMLLVGAGKGLEGRDRELGELLGGLCPINNDLRELNTEVATRKENLARLIHNFGELTGAIGAVDEDVTELVSTSNEALGAIAENDPDVQRTVQLLAPTLAEARVALQDATQFAAELGPAFHELRPFARNLEGMNASLERLAGSTTSVIRDEIRPFVRTAREPVGDLRTAAERFSGAAPRLTVIGRKINRLGNLAAHNPDGTEAPGTTGSDDVRDEGYLYWAAWLGHNGNSVFNAGDAHGTYRRIYFNAPCAELFNIIRSAGGGGFDPIASVVTGFDALFAPGGACSGETPAEDGE